MKFERPIVFLDIESTGVDPEHDKILELALIKVRDNSHGMPLKTVGRFNPGIHIPEESSKIHGILDEHVAESPMFCDKAGAIFNFIENCDLAGFNSNKFDVPLLFFELQRCGYNLDYNSVNLLDAGNIFKIMEPRTLEAGVKFYLHRDHEGAHTSLADVEATYELLFAQLMKYPDLPESVSELAKMANYDRPFLDILGKFSLDEEGDYIFNFGPQKGRKVKDEMGFLNWMFKKDFNEDTMNWATKIQNSILYEV